MLHLPLAQTALFIGETPSPPLCVLEQVEAGLGYGFRGENPGGIFLHCLRHQAELPVTGLVHILPGVPLPPGEARTVCVHGGRGWEGLGVSVSLEDQILAPI